MLKGAGSDVVRQVGMPRWAGNGPQSAVTLNQRLEVSRAKFGGPMGTQGLRKGNLNTG